MKLVAIFLLCVAAVASSPFDYAGFRKAPTSHSYSVFNKDISDPHFLRRILMPTLGKEYYAYLPTIYSQKAESVPFTSAKEQTTIVEGGKKSTTTTTTSKGVPTGKNFVPVSMKHSVHPYTIYNVRNTLPVKGKHIAYPIYEQKPITIVNVKNKHPAPLPPKIPQQPITIMNIKNHHQAPVIPADPQNIHIMNIDKEFPAPPPAPQLPAQVSIMNIDENKEEDIYVPVSVPTDIVSEEHVITEGVPSTKGKDQENVVVQETTEPYEEVYSRTGRSAPAGYEPIPLDLSFAEDTFHSGGAVGDGWESVAVPVSATTEMPIVYVETDVEQVAVPQENLETYNQHEEIVEQPIVQVEETVEHIPETNTYDVQQTEEVAVVDPVHELE